MEFIVSDMTCGGCANAITRAVSAADSAAKLDIDVPMKRVKITSTLAEQQLVEVIEAAGFHPSRGS